MKRHLQILAAASGVMLAVTTTRADQFYATQVTSRTVGSPFQSANQNPADILGAPSGRGTSQGSTRVLNLGVGGSVTVGFDDPNGPATRTITNGSGADFIVSENAFYAGSNSFAELVYVEVSSNGSDFARFPVLSATSGPVSGLGTINPNNVSGFAGVHAVLANADDAPNGINPFDPATAGGDAFDLSSLLSDSLVLAGKVDLNDIRYVRLIDVIGDGRDLDALGRPIYDPTGSGNGGADIDSIAVIDGVTVVPEPGSLAILGLASGLALRRRSRRCPS